MKKGKRILFAVLNWGLGHASRSIPLIRYFLEQGVEVILASDGRALHLLQEEFPNLKFVELPAYNISYASENMFWNIGWQLPKIGQAVRAENRFIQTFIHKEKIDAIVSDNRFGCYSYSVPSVFISHQINIKIGFPFLEKIVNRINRYFIQKFDVCWIPDFEGVVNCAGLLSHQHKLEQVAYLGALSRMKRLDNPIKRDLIVILSGPEPQRSKLEEKLVAQLQASTYKTLLVQGITESFEEKTISKNLKIISFLTSQDLNKAICESRFVICRSGYSSIMDLVQLQKQALLIPTPGQTEQEYLIEHFDENHLFVGQTQKDLDIEKGIGLLKQKKGMNKTIYLEIIYKKVVQDFIKEI